jgi:hypothetical protein
MGFFDRLFGSSSERTPQPDIKFGRYSDSYKQAVNYNAWDAALEKFENEEYLESYQAFFRYLRDEEEDNVKYWEDNGGIRFELYQGSKKITGFADAAKIKAEAKIARTQALNVGFMRRLIEKNFSLKYSRFGLDPEHNITIVFDTYTLDGSPYKLYYALKELATNADKQDDLLLDEFLMLEPVDTSHLVELPPAEKEVKYHFIVGRINEVLNEVENGDLNSDQYPGGIAYLLLDLIYRLDFLIKPEGYMMETLERVHRLYFSKDGKSTAQKNQMLIRELRKLADRPKEEFFKEMYRVTSTFGITTPVNHDRVVSFIDGELHNMDWYWENGHLAVALAIPGYIVGYCMFNYAIPKPDRDLMQLYFQVTEPAYFRDLGFTVDYRDPETGDLNRRAIKRAVDAIVEDNKDSYPRLSPATGSLDFQSLPAFAKSFLLMIRNMEVTKVE